MDQRLVSVRSVAVSILVAAIPLRPAVAQRSADDSVIVVARAKLNRGAPTMVEFRTRTSPQLVIFVDLQRAHLYDLAAALELAKRGSSLGAAPGRSVIDDVPIGAENLALSLDQQHEISASLRRLEMSMPVDVQGLGTVRAIRVRLPSTWFKRIRR